MMTEQSLLYERKNGIAVITLNRPKAVNAINTGLLRELDSLLNSVAADFNSGQG